jgi:hypothetical protein
MEELSREGSDEKGEEQNWRSSSFPTVQDD